MAHADGDGGRFDSTTASGSNAGRFAGPWSLAGAVLQRLRRMSPRPAYSGVMGSLRTPAVGASGWGSAGAGGGGRTDKSA